ncbi:MAG TPA: TIM44-like domain-containing protein [Gemmataceae bacterium]|nr:TIM44-like domain-containing protein [Gemmataceae bacterium]
MMRRSPWPVLKRALRMLVPLLLLAACVTSADARVGGGQSYSGGGGHGGGGGSGGGGNGAGEVILWILWGLFDLTVHYPAIGIPLDILVLSVFVGIVYWRSTRARPVPSYSSQEQHLPGRRQTAPAERALDALREHDPNFSTVLFQDFVYALYARVQEARGRKDLPTWSPYLSPKATEALGRRGGPGLRRVGGIIVAASRVVGVSNPEGGTVVAVEFETNYTETYDSGRETTWYARERWSFSRDAGVLSRPPETITALHCPKCGGALEQGADGACRHCGVKITGGRFDWYVTGVRLLTCEDKGPLLTRSVQEVGTDLPTIFHPRLAATRARFLAQNPDFDWDRLSRRIRHTFVELQAAWSERDWETARPYVSDALFQMLNYWITEYRRQHLRNVLEDVKVESLDLVKVSTDAYYDALTFRIFARMRDYTTDEQGKVVCGSPHSVRRFSEYWTFIRRRGAGEKTHGDKQCPNCGAPLKINMAGVCEYCRGKVTSGEFDWVLSRIEQDEAYQG